MSNIEGCETTTSETSIELTPDQRAAALAEVKDSLAAVQALHRFNYNSPVTEHEASPSYLEMLHKKIIVPKHIFNDNPLSPTPADPHNVVDAEGNGYFSASRDMMTERFQKVAKEIGLDDMARISILAEIETQHQLQCDKNAANYDKFCDILVESGYLLNDDMRAMITRIRSGEATSAERIILMSLFPEMEAIEDMKITAPLDAKAFKRAIRTYMAGLIRLNNHSSDIDLKLLPQSEQEPRVTYAHDNGKGRIAVAKAVIAEARVRNVVLEFVARGAYYYFPASTSLKGVAATLVNIPPDGETVNKQQISALIYIRVKKTAHTHPDEASARAGEQPDLDEILRIANTSFSNNLRA